MIGRLKRANPYTLLRVACVLALIALALMVWGFIEKTSLTLMASMSIAQFLGTLSFAAFLWVYFRSTRIRSDAEPKKPDEESQS